MLRTGLAASLVVLLIPVVVAANASTWALRTVLDARTFSSTVGRVMDTPSVEVVLAGALSDGIIDRVGRAPTPGKLDVAQRLVARQIGLPADADDATVRAALRDRIRGAWRDPAVERVRDDVIATVHGYLVGVAEGEPGLVSVQGRNLVLDTSGILDRIEQDADPQVAALVENVPPDLTDAVVVAPVAALEPIGKALTAMETLRLLLPLVAMTVALLVVLTAHRRARALGIVGLALVVAAVLSILVVWVAGRYVAGVPDAQVARQVTREVYQAFLSMLVAQSVILIIVGVGLAFAGWYAQIRDRRRATERMLGPR